MLLPVLHMYMPQSLQCSSIMTITGLPFDTKRYSVLQRDHERNTLTLIRLVTTHLHLLATVLTMASAPVQCEVLSYLWRRPVSCVGAQVGGATASHPLGPWTKMPQNPILRPGSTGSWDAGMVASATILKFGPNNWTMWYEVSSFGTHCCWVS